MARAKSVVLTKDEKKALVADLKAKIKANKDAGKGIATSRKDADKALAAAQKAHAAALKANDKAAAGNAKELAALEKQLAAVVA